MAYQQGTITSATPAADLRLAIEAVFNLHDNWDFVESLVISSETYYIYLNRGGGLGANDFGQDFHVLMYHLTDGTGLLGFRTFEAWDSVNKKVIRPASPRNPSQSINANGSYGDETVGFDVNADLVPYTRISANTTGYEYFCQVTKNTLKISLKVGTAAPGVYAGLFEPLMPDEPFPLCMAQSRDYSSYSFERVDWVMVSRHPKKTTGNTDYYNFAHELRTFSEIGGSISEDDLFHGKAIGSRLLLLTDPSGSAGTYGKLRGLLYDCLYFSASGAQPGDRMNVGLPDEMVALDVVYYSTYPMFVPVAAE